MMAEKPILFNTQMVRAILEGRKTQTRRLVKGLPLAEPYFTVEDGKPLMCDENGEWYPAERFSTIQPGDILWVRETWKQATTGTAGPGLIDLILYRADEPQDTSGMMVEDRWHPSIHMRRIDARLFLRVKEVRVERLQYISRGEAISEGCNAAIPILEFKGIWDSTIKKVDIPFYGWDANPWVWVIEFERINPQIL